MDERLASLHEKYSLPYDNLPAGMRELYNRIVKNSEATLLDAAAATAAVNALFLSDTIDYSKVSPKMKEAFELAYPNVELESLADRAPEELSGFISGWKGKYFEVIVRDELNAGNAVGDLVLNPGQLAILAESPTQPAWDLQILNDDGTIADAMQLKATNSVEYVHRALEKYPDIQILTTSEVGKHADGLADTVLSSDINNEDITEKITEPLSSLLDSPAGEFLEDILPALPFVIIAVSEGRKIMIGRQTFQQAINKSLERSIKSGASIGVGALVYWLDGGLLSLPATLLTRIGIDRVKITGRTSGLIDKGIETNRRLLTAY